MPKLFGILAEGCGFRACALREGTHAGRAMPAHSQFLARWSMTKKRKHTDTTVPPLLAGATVEDVMAALLRTPPPPAGDKSTRKAAPKPRRPRKWNEAKRSSVSASAPSHAD